MKMFGFEKLFYGICCFVFVCSTFEVNVNAQCSKPNSYPNVVLAPEFSQLNDFPNGTKVQYECITGYIRKSGSRYSTCSDGKWSSLTLQCEKRTCGAPPEIINGRYNINEGTDFGARIYVICNEGYELANQNNYYRTCTIDGWDNHDPICEAVNCGIPPTIDNGTSNIRDDIRYPQSVEYTCKDDYTLIGPSFITCSADGTFKPAPPNCTVVWCWEPVIVKGRRVQGSPPYRYKSYVLFECIEGYKMNGQARLTCDVNGWSPGIPTCTMVSPTTQKTTATSTTPTARSTVHVSQPPTTRKVTTSKTAVTTRSTTHGSGGKGVNITPNALSVAIGLLFPAILELFF